MHVGYKATGPLCDFDYTGYRVPLIVISPFTKKNYVSHTVADMTAILKFIETRFNLPALTKRDAAQPDMTEYFRLLESALDDSSNTAGTADQRPLLHGSPALIPE